MVEWLVIHSVPQPNVALIPKKQITADKSILLHLTNAPIVLFSTFIILKNDGVVLL